MIDDISENCVTYSCSFLDLRSLHCLLRVSKDLNVASQHAIELFEGMELDEEIQEEELGVVCSRRRLKRIHFGFQITKLTVLKVLNHCRNLEEVTFDNSLYHRDGVLKIIAENLPKLKTLHFCQSPAPSEIELLSKKCPQLENLELFDDQTAFEDDLFIGSIFVNCKQLKKVYLLKYPGVLDECDFLLGPKFSNPCSKLTDLSLCKCWIVDTDCRVISKIAPNLTSLNLAHNEITADCISYLSRLPLRSLAVNATAMSFDSVCCVAEGRYFKNMETLVVSGYFFGQMLKDCAGIICGIECGPAGGHSRIQLSRSA